MLVVDESSSPLLFEVRLPDQALSQPLQWQLTEENGSHREGQVRPADLALAGEEDIDGERFVMLQLNLDLHPPVGYHRLTVEGADGKGAMLTGQCTLIITPQRCYVPPGLLQEARIWGISCHLEAIRSRRNWGIGDLTDLQNIMS